MSQIILIGINAKYIHSNPAIYSLKAYAGQYFAGEAREELVEIAEYTINQSKASILADIYRRKPKVAAFSCYIWNWNMVQDILLELPKILPELQIWLGGPEVSFHAQQILCQYPAVTGIMTGEGEETFLELLYYYRHKDRQLAEIKGIVTHEGFTGKRELTDINRLPFLYNDLSRFANRILYYESQRGCPFSCAYCLSSIDKRVRLREIATVRKELQFFLDNKVSQVKFIDRTFNCNAAHAMAVWEYLKEHDNGVTNFHFEIAADLLREEQLELISGMRPGLIQLEIGVQSTNEKTLHAINRYMSLERLQETVARVHSFQNTHQHLDLIAGLPFEDYKSFAHSFDDVYRMKPQQLQLGFLKVLKGSPMEEKASEYGIIYSTKPPYEVLYSNWLSYEEVLKLKAVEEMVELYYNSCQFTHTLPVLELEFDSPFGMYEQLAGYYGEKGYFTNSPARVYRYQILLEFAISCNPDREQMYRQLLTFDMYLRENLKSRPAFAENQEAYKEDIREFYRQESNDRKYLEAYAGCKAPQLMKMTHLEVFTYPVWSGEALEGIQPLEEPGYILFDYQKRNPLTYEAAYYQVKPVSEKSYLYGEEEHNE